ncbi:MAG: hypothetical protein ACK5MT_12995 [Actinomycetales bacterium]
MNVTVRGGTDNPSGNTRIPPRARLEPEPIERPSAALVATLAGLCGLLLLGGGLAVSVQLTPPTQVTSTGGAQNPCWTALDGDGQCPALEGEQALRTLLPAEPDFDLCEPSQPDSDFGELESLVCNWDDLPEVYVFVSRWDDAASAREYARSAIATPEPADAAGMRGTWTSESLSPPGSDNPAWAFGYVSYPYSAIVIGPEPARDLARARLKPRPVAWLEDQL